MSIAETLAGVRASLAQVGVPPPETNMTLRDQTRASFRVDLLSLGVDPAAEGVLEAALAGLVVGMKLLIQQQIPVMLIAQYVGVCETLLPMISEQPADVSELPDVDFLRSLHFGEEPEEPEEICTLCGLHPAVLDLANGMNVCLGCAKGIVTGGMEMMRRSGMLPERPQVGGPTFSRGSDTVGPESWWDTKLRDLFRRKRH